MITSQQEEELLWKYDRRHIPSHIAICSPYFKTNGYNETKSSGKVHGVHKLTTQQRRAMSNRYNMYEARRICDQVVITRLLMADVTVEEIKEKFGISPNTVRAAERNGAVTKDGYHFVKVKQGCRPMKQIELFQ